MSPLWLFLMRFGPPRWSEYVVQNWTGQRLVIAIPYLWLLIFFLIPFLIVLKISFAEFSPLGRPPYEPVFRWLEEGALQIKLLIGSYVYLFNEPLYVSAWLYSLKVAFFSTVFCLMLGYPMAYAISRSPPTQRNVLLLLIILPFWTSFLLRVYAWIGLLKTDGLINQVLFKWFGIVDEPLAMMNTSFAVYIGIVYSYLPFMILPLYSNLEKHDNTLLEAAQDLGAGPIKSFLRVTLPLSFPGIVAGSLLVFIPAVGEYVIPSLLGRTDQLMVAKLLSDEFFLNRDWPRASAVAIAMLLLLVVPIMVFQRFQNKELQAAEKMKNRRACSPSRCSGWDSPSSTSRSCRWCSFSFNNSRLVTVWDAANSPTVKWYVQLFKDHQILSAAWLSIQVAAATATGAVILGTLAGLVLSRFGPFRGRAFLQGLTTAPLVMPEVITGLSMLLLFVSLEQLFTAWFGWQFDRGFATITIAHITFTMAYVTVVVQSRLAGFDDSLEEAALDLGARPAKVFFRITVPLILPAILSGWLLAFTLSWDDLVVTQFVSGPGSNTLPMVIFSRVRLGVSPVVNALATIMVLVVALGVVLSAILMRRQEQRRKREEQMAAAG